MNILINALLVGIAAQVGSGSVLCLAESIIPDVVIAGCSNRLVVFAGQTGEIIFEYRQVSGPVTAIAVDRGTKQLAIAHGRPSSKTQLDIYSLDEKGCPSSKKTHFGDLDDQIYSLKFQPGSTGIVAGAGYGRKLYLWDTKANKLAKVIRDHSDAIRDLAWHPSGRSLASCSCDRTAKVWDPESGRCVHSLNDSSDWMYSIGWAEDGRVLAGGGVDKLLRVWESKSDGFKIRKSTFAHDSALVSLAARGHFILTLGEDGFLKKWTNQDLKLSDKTKFPVDKSPSCLMISNSGEHAWVGSFAGDVHFIKWQSLAVVKTLSLVQKPKIGMLVPDHCPRGVKVNIQITGSGLDQLDWKKVSIRDAEIKVLEISQDGKAVSIEIRFAPSCLPGFRELVLSSFTGETAKAPLAVCIGPITAKFEDRLNQSHQGLVSRAGQVDRHRLSLKKGQEVGILLDQAPGSMLDCRLSIIDPKGVLWKASANTLGLIAEDDGAYELLIHDREYRVGNSKYWLHVGNFPVINAVFPSHVEAGQPAKVRLIGANLGTQADISLPADPKMAPGSRLPVPASLRDWPGATGPMVEPFPQVSDFQRVHSPPFGASGWITPETPNPRWRFHAKAGGKLVMEVHSARLGYPVDTILMVKDASGKPLVRTVLQPVDQTTVSFRNHEPKSPGIRLEKWTGLAPNDFLYAGGDVLRIRALPRNPDDDCQFFASGGKRIGWFGTTPNQHPLGQTLLKVIPRKPGDVIESTAWPAIAVPWINDDGDNDTGTDSKLIFDPPETGEFVAEISDASGISKIKAAYHLSIRTADESFAASTRSGESPLSDGGSAEIVVDIKRNDGWEGSVLGEIIGLPEGMIGTRGFASGLESSMLLTLCARESKVIPPFEAKIRLTGQVGGQLIVRELPLPKIKPMSEGDVTIIPGLRELSVEPGGKVLLPVAIDRRMGFSGRVPIDVRGLPQGVRVLNVGLNGILLPPGQQDRVLEIEVDSWVSPSSLTFVVSARREGKPEFVGKPISLHVRRPGN